MQLHSTLSMLSQHQLRLLKGWNFLQSLFCLPHAATSNFQTLIASDVESSYLSKLVGNISLYDKVWVWASRFGSGRYREFMNHYNASMLGLGFIKHAVYCNQKFH